MNADYWGHYIFYDKHSLMYNDNAKYYYTLGQAAESINETEIAEKAYMQAIKLDSSYPLPYINLGAMYDTNERYDEALALLLKAYEIDRSLLAVNNNLGNVYLHKELYNDSIKHYITAIKMKPNNRTRIFFMIIDI